MENTTCEFCNKTFTNKYNLLAHQKTTKSCLEKQGIKTEEYKCEYCSKILASNKRLITHIDICKFKNKNDINKYKELFDQKEQECNKYKQEISMMKENIQELKTQLKEANSTIAEIAKQPKNINQVSNTDNRIRNQHNITQSFDINDVNKISKVLETHLTPNVLAGGQKGLAEMLKTHLLQNEKGEPIYECTDVSRQKFEFINKHGYIESDPKAAKLLTSLNNANIFNVAHATGKKLWETDKGVNHDAQHFHMPKVTEVLDIKEDSTKFRSHLASITSR